MFDLTGRKALVTGATGGLGEDGLGILPRPEPGRDRPHPRAHHRLQAGVLRRGQAVVEEADHHDARARHTQGGEQEQTQEEPVHAFTANR